MVHSPKLHNHKTIAYLSQYMFIHSFKFWNYNQTHNISSAACFSLPYFHEDKTLLRWDLDTYVCPLCLCYPGSPSGHAMGAAGVYYTLVTSILAITTSKKKFGSKKSNNKDWWVKELFASMSVLFTHFFCPELITLDTLSVLCCGWSLTYENYCLKRGDCSWAVLTSMQLKLLAHVGMLGLAKLN